jgi:hypothetical protein
MGYDGLADFKRKLAGQVSEGVLRSPQRRCPRQKTSGVLLKSGR